MKKFLTILLTACMMLSAFTGCNPSETPSESKADTKKDDVTLTMWIWDDAQAPATQAMIDEFEKNNPHIKVELTSIAGGVSEYNMKMQSVVGTKAAPSVFWMNINLGREYIKDINEKFVQDLTSFINDDDSFNIGTLNAGITDAYTYDGKIYAIPKDTDSYGLYYNKKLFDDAGVDYPEADWTLAEFAEIAKKVSTDQVDGWSNTLSDRVYSGMIYSNGGDIYNDSGEGSNIDSDAAAEVIQMAIDMMAEGSAHTGTNLAETDSASSFSSGLSAMTIDGSWMISQFADALGDDLGIQEVPSGAAGKTTVGHGIGYATTTSNPHLEETWLFLSYLGSDSAQKKQAKVVIPAANASASAWEDEYPGINTSAFVNALAYSRPIPLAAKNSSVVRGKLQEEVSNVCNGVYTNGKEAVAAIKVSLETEINK